MIEREKHVIDIVCMQWRQFGLLSDSSGWLFRCQTLQGRCSIVRLFRVVVPLSDLGSLFRCQTLRSGSLFRCYLLGAVQYTAFMDQEPHQPRNLVFPKRNFGQSRIVQRSFQGSWFDSYPWLHYDEALDLVFCHICARAEKEGKLMANCKDSAFLSKGFSNWKDATEGFRRHERSKCHADAVQVIVVLPRTTRDVGETLSTIHAREKANNRRALLKIIANIRYFGRQGLPLRGHDDAESNFHQLLKLQKRRDPGLAQWLERKGDKYCSPEIQNEFLKLLSLSVLRDIAENIQGADFFTVMADECADISNHEQLTVCFRWVDSQLEVHEEFIGLYAIPDITADTIVAALRDCVLRLNLNWSRCRGQCFDGASNMTAWTPQWSSNTNHP